MSTQYSDWTVKAADTGEANAIASFLAAGFAKHNLRFTDAYVAEEMKGGTWHIVLSGKRILGTLLLKRVDRDNRGELKHLLVADEARLKGIGRQLLETAVAEAEKAGLRKLTGMLDATQKYALRILLDMDFELEGILKSHFRSGENVLVFSKFFHR